MMKYINFAAIGLGFVIFITIPILIVFDLGFIKSGLAGLVCATIMVLISYYYFSWRNEVLHIEFLIPYVFGGIIGAKFYKILK